MKIKVIFLTAVISFCCSGVSSAGLLSVLAKAGKKIDGADVSTLKLADIDTKYLNLPDADNIQLVGAKLDANKTWTFTAADGVPVKALSDLDNPVLYLDKAHLPRDISLLESLPVNRTLLLRDGNSVFELSRSPNLSLKAGGASIPVTSYRQLHDAAWHFKKPWKNGPVRVLGLNDEVDNALSLRKGVDTNVLLNSPQQLREQTIVLAGPVKDGAIKVAGKKFPLQDLIKQGEEFDISFVVLETPRKTAPKKIASQLDNIGVFDGQVSTGEFLTSLQGADSLTTYRVASSGKAQTQISLIPKVPEITNSPAPVSLESNLGKQVAIHSLIKGVTLVRPSEQRQRELDQLYFFGIPSWLLMLYIMGLVLGVWAWQECRWLWNKLWSMPQRPVQGIGFAYAVWFLCLLLLFVPLIGTYAAVFKVIRAVLTFVWKVLMFVYNAISWPFRRLTRNSVD